MKHYITLTNSELSARISENIHSQRDRHILRLRLIDGLTYEKIAEVVELSPRYIRALCRKLMCLIIT
jgi:DNA-directed RNA polymerase specialized sigma subunit